MAERKLVSSLIAGKCPRCREGDMFTHDLLNLRKFGHMHQYCPHCGHQFEQEPGFYYGAMYVSYALSVGIFLITAALLYTLAGDPSLSTYIITIGVVALILYPVNFRYSRILFTYLFGGVRYDPHAGR